MSMVCFFLNCFFVKNKSDQFIFNDPLDFLANSSDYPESTDFIPEPQNENPGNSTLNYQHGKNSSW